MKKTKKSVGLKTTYGFDVNDKCYCSLCERTYKNYKRFFIHMRDKHYKCLQNEQPFGETVRIGS